MYMFLIYTMTLLMIKYWTKSITESRTADRTFFLIREKPRSNSRRWFSFRKLIITRHSRPLCKVDWKMKARYFGNLPRLNYVWLRNGQNKTRRHISGTNKHLTQQCTLYWCHKLIGVTQSLVLLCFPSCSWLQNAFWMKNTSLTIVKPSGKC